MTGDRAPGPGPQRTGLHQEQQHRRKDKRWQREAPTHLWQLDLAGGIFVADGRECRMLTGIDDHSRYVVIAEVLAVQSERAVADAFVRAMHSRPPAPDAGHGHPASLFRPADARLEQPVVIPNSLAVRA